MNRYLLFICLLLVFTAILPARGRDEQLILDADPDQMAMESWPRWRGERGDGVVIDATFDPEALKRENILVWKIDAGRGFSAPSIQGNSLYIAGEEKGREIVRALNAFTGEEIWSKSYDFQYIDHPGTRTTPIIDAGPTAEEDRLYLFTTTGLLVCMKAADGEEIWTKDIVRDFGARPPTWGFSSSPVITGDTLLLNVAESGIAINKNTGEEIWRSRGGVCGYSTPVLFSHNNLKLAAMFGRDSVYAVHVDSGEIEWEIPWKTSYNANAADPLIFDTRILLSTGYGTGCALYDFSGQVPVELWRNKNIASHFSSIIHKNGYIYGIHGQTSSPRGEIRCLNAETGVIVWGQRTGFGSLIMVNEKLVIASESGMVYVADASPEGYAESSSAKITKPLVWTMPVISHGLLYIKSDYGYLSCVNMRPE